MLTVYYTIYNYRDRSLEETYRDKLIQFCLSDLGLTDSKVKKSPSGKPFITNSELKISITHKLDYIMTAVSDKEIGIDLEYIDSDNSSLASRIMPEEIFRRYIKSEDPAYFLYSYFSAREAYSKYLGKGLPVLLNKKEIPIKVFQTTFENKRRKFVLSVCGDRIDEINESEFKFADFSLINQNNT